MISLAELKNNQLVDENLKGFTHFPGGFVKGVKDCLVSGLSQRLSFLVDGFLKIFEPRGVVSSDGTDGSERLGFSWL